MAERIQFGDRIYDLSSLSDEGRRTFDMLRYAEQRLQECRAREEALKYAKNAFITELRAEIVKAKTGIGFGALLSD